MQAMEVPAAVAVAAVEASEAVGSVWPATAVEEVESEEEVTRMARTTTRRKGVTMRPAERTAATPPLPGTPSGGLNTRRRPLRRALRRG